MNRETIRIAKAVLRAIEIRNDSYDREASDKAEHDYEKLLIELKKNRLLPTPGEYGGYLLSSIDPTVFYRKTVEESCMEAAEESGLDKITGMIIGLSFGQIDELVAWANMVFACIERDVGNGLVRADCGHPVPYGELCCVQPTNSKDFPWVCDNCIEKEFINLLGGKEPQ